MGELKKEKKTIINVIIVIGIICCLFYILGINSKNEDENKNNINIIEKVDEKEDMYYKDDETLNSYITKFNKLYPNNKITNDIFEVYYHHGKEHKNQLKFIMNDLNIILTKNYSNNVSVYIENTSKDDKNIKAITKKFVKVFNPLIPDENIEKYIDEPKTNSSINKHEDIEFWINRNIDGEYIEYITITGKIN